MPASNHLQYLISALRDAGVRVNDGRTPLHGFPLVLNMAAWPPVVLDVNDPGLLSIFDPTTLGVAIIDSTGQPRARWGLAESIELLGTSDALAESPIGGLVELALEGKPRSTFSDGHRYYVSAYSFGETQEAVVLVVNADEEAAARAVSREHQTSTLALKRIGRALSSKQSIRSLAVAALHAIYSSYELSAAFLWIDAEGTGKFSLVSSIGTSRSLPELNVIDVNGKSIASLALRTTQMMSLDNIGSSPLTDSIEASICNISAGPVIVMPLLSKNKSIGALELVAKSTDSSFSKSDEMFKTIAEHLALAIHNAILFEEAERLAMYDPLTGIANHRTMQDFLAQRVSEATRTGETVGVVMIDVDHFRQFNEEEGHDAGDEVLKLVANELKAQVRNYDLAARYGGEEFTLILSGTNESVIVEVAERVRKSIERLHNLPHKGKARKITVSLGCAVFPDVADTPAELLKAADRALYAAKRGGRNRTVLFRLGDAA